jgi:hypothetical protein
MNLYTRARMSLPLTPSERSFLKVLKGFVISAAIAAFMTAAQLVPNGGAVDWAKVLLSVIVAFVTTLCFALDKYWSAQGDTIPAVVAGDIGTAVASSYPAPSAPKAPAPVAPAAPPAVSPVAPIVPESNI